MLTGASAAAADPTWQQVRQHLPIDRQGVDSYTATPTAEDCASASYCVVAGQYDTDDPSLPQRVFLDTEVDGTKTSIAAPVPDGATSVELALFRVSCAADRCAVAGSVGTHATARGAVEVYQDGASDGTAETGARWSVQTLPVPSWLPAAPYGAGVELSQISCTGEACLATGTFGIYDAEHQAVRYGALLARG